MIAEARFRRCRVGCVWNNKHWSLYGFFCEAADAGVRLAGAQAVLARVMTPAFWLLACYTALCSTPAFLLLAALHALPPSGLLTAARLCRHLAAVPRRPKPPAARSPHALSRLQSLLARCCLQAMGVPPGGVIAAHPQLVAPRTIPHPRSHPQPAVPQQSAPRAASRAVTLTSAPLRLPALGSTTWSISYGPGAPASCPEATGCGLPVALAVIASGASSSKLRPGLYVGQAVESVMCMKIHSHEAYRHRSQVAAALHRQMYAAPHEPPTLLATTLVPGCLQLFLSSFSLGPPHSSPPPTGPPGPPNPLDGPPSPTPSPLDTLIAGLHSALPSFCHHQPVSVQIGGRRGVFQTPPALPQFHDLQLSPAAPPCAPLALPPAAIGIPAPVASLMPELSSVLLLEPPCVPAAAPVPVAVVVRLEGCGVLLEGEEEVEVVTSWMECGAPCTCKRSLPLDNTGLGFRLELPAGLDTGAMSVKVISLRTGYTGTLLASNTTMALPAPAAQELCDLHASSTAPADRAGVRRLLLDMAVAWQLLQMEYDGPAGPTLLAGLLQYCSDTQLDACQQLLADRCAAAGWLVVHAAPAASPARAPKAAPGMALGGAMPNMAAGGGARSGGWGDGGAPVGEIAAHAQEEDVQAAIMCMGADGEAAGRRADTEPAAAAVGACSCEAFDRQVGKLEACTGGQGSGGHSCGRCQASNARVTDGKAAVASAAEGKAAQGSAQDGGGPARAAAGKPTAHAAPALPDMTYDEWKRELAQRADRAAPAAYAVVWAAMASTVLFKAPGEMQQLQLQLLLVGLVLNWAALSLPHVLLLRSRGRLPRAAAMAIQCLGRVCCVLASSWLRLPQGFRMSGISITASFAVNSVFRPCFQLITWRTQLVLQVIEVACKAIVMLLPVPFSRPHAPPAVSLRRVLHYSLAAVLVCLLTNLLVERWSRMAFLRAHGARGTRAAAAAGALPQSDGPDPQPAAHSAEPPGAGQAAAGTKEQCRAAAA